MGIAVIRPCSSVDKVARNASAIAVAISVWMAKMFAAVSCRSRWTDDIIDGWDETNMSIKSYNAGTMGPGEATALMAVDGRNWYE